MKRRRFLEGLLLAGALPGEVLSQLRPRPRTRAPRGPRVPRPGVRIPGVRRPGPKPPRDLKVVVVGDPAVGKTCLLIRQSTGTFPGSYIPTVFDNYSSTLTLDEREHRLGLWDTAGQEDYDRLRPLSYPQTDLFLVCVSTVRVASYESVASKWAPEIRHHVPDARFLLVGCKSDLRRKPAQLRRGQRPVPRVHGEDVAARVGALAYLECSALTGAGIRTVFEAAARRA